MSCSTPLQTPLQTGTASKRRPNARTSTSTAQIIESNGRVRVLVNRRQVYSGLRLLSVIEANSDGLWINGAMIVCALDDETVKGNGVYMALWFNFH